jgi:acetoin utilization protein AcuB
MKPATDLESRERPSPPSPTTIRQVMTPAPHTIGTDQTLAAAHALMRTHGLRHLPVLRGGRLVGVLSQRDLYFLETISGVDVDIDQVADAMTPDVYSVAPEVEVREVARIMAMHKYGCAVVTENGKIMGIFTANDALRHLADLLPSR